MASAILGGPRRMKEINKEEFKKEIEDYVKVLFRKTIKEADQQQL